MCKSIHVDIDRHQPSLRAVYRTANLLTESSMFKEPLSLLSSLSIQIIVGFAKLWKSLSRGRDRRIVKIIERDKETYTWFGLESSTMWNNRLRSMKCQLGNCSSNRMRKNIVVSERRHNVKATASHCTQQRVKEAMNRFASKGWTTQRMDDNLFDRSIVDRFETSTDVYGSFYWINIQIISLLKHSNYIHTNRK